MLRCLPRISALLVVALGAARAQAGPVLTVDFSNGQTFQTTNSTISEAVTVPRFGSASGAIDATMGVLRATDASLPPRDSTGAPNGGVLQVNTFLTDNYTLHGSGPGMTTIPVHMFADGTMSMPALDAQGDANSGVLSLAPGNGGSGTFNVGLTTDPHSVDAFTTLVQPGLYSLSEITTFNVTFSGTLSLQLTYELTLRAVGGPSLDFSSTAQIHFDLPPGTSITSDGGYFQAASVIPEPLSLVLVASGLATLGVGRIALSRRGKTG